ncbi:hypothetical protein HY772_09895 [Candidatus Woesearchaeota archaeon]|nr:hypothetical protein [Candidatus Woesearchaeota archaeon]
MAIFNTISSAGYAHSMDRAYFVNEQNSQEVIPEGKKKPVVGVKDIGMTVIDGPNAGRFSQSITAALRSGASRLELQPIPAGGGSSGGDVDEYGYEERQEIKDLAKINEVELTSVHVHHSTVANLSGMSREGFSEHQRYTIIDEVKRHIDFAADAIDGGSIVVHTAEFPRAIGESRHIDKRYFEGFPGEEKERIHSLINPQTGQIVNIREDQEVWVPVPEKDEKGRIKWLTDEQGRPVVDEFWRTHPAHTHKFNEDGTLKPEYAADSKLFYIPTLKYDLQGNIRTEKQSFKLFKEQEENRGKDEREVLKDFFLRQQQAEITSALGQARQFEVYYYKGIERRKRLMEALDYWKQREKDYPPEEKWRLRRQLADHLPPDIVVPEEKSVTEYLTDLLNDNTRELSYGRETSTSGRTRARMIQDMIQKVQFLEDYAVKKSANSLAELGAYAMKITDEKQPKKDIYITPENMLPEMGWGTHPRELLELITTAREKMIERLTSPEIPDPSGKLGDDGKPLMVKSNDYLPGMTKEQAKQEAETHIKATLDTSHLGQWYKHFKYEVDPRTGGKESEESRLKRFHKWYMEEVENLSKHNVVGNIHVVDTFGRSHVHLTAGKGPMADVVIQAVEYLKEKGVKSISSEASGDIREIMTGTWRAFGSNIYSVGRGTVPFGAMERSYFGRNPPPSYVFGAYSPSEDWTLWSGVPFE